MEALQLILDYYHRIRLLMDGPPLLQLHPFSPSAECMVREAFYQRTGESLLRLKLLSYWWNIKTTAHFLVKQDRSARMLSIERRRSRSNWRSRHETSRYRSFDASSPLYRFLGTGCQWWWAWLICRIPQHPETKTPFMFPTVERGRRLGGRTQSSPLTIQIKSSTISSVTSASAIGHAPERGRRSRPRPSIDLDDSQSLWLWWSRTTRCPCQSSGKLSREWRPSCRTKSKIWSFRGRGQRQTRINGPLERKQIKQSPQTTGGFILISTPTIVVERV